MRLPRLVDRVGLTPAGIYALMTLMTLIFVVAVALPAFQHHDCGRPAVEDR